MLNLDKCFEEVQNSNMSKLGKDGKPIYNDKGKVIKLWVDLTFLIGPISDKFVLDEK